jgi:hypothetical protein
MAGRRALVSHPRRAAGRKIPPIMLAAAALCAPYVVNAQNDSSAVPIPHEMRFCSQICFDFIFEGNNRLVNRTNLLGQQNDKRVLIIEKFTPGSVIIHRVDTGSFPMSGITYEGKMEPGNNAVHGANWRIRWGDAIRSQRDGVVAPNTISRGNGAVARQPPAQAADWTKDPVIMPGHEPVIQDFHLAGKLNLSGLWQASKVTPDKKEFIVVKFDIRQREDDSIELVNAYAPTGWAGVTTFKGKLQGSQITGMGVAPDSTATNVHLTQPASIHVDDPDHIHAEVGDKMPLYRLNPRADDAPCDAQNSAHVDPGWAYARGRDAKWEKKDNLKAACWFQIAALSGMAQAQGMLASQFYNGEGVATNYEQSFAWAQKSTAQDNMLGEWVLSNLYEHGQGVPADPRKAHALREHIAQQKIDTILSHPDAKTPSGLTVRQAITGGFAFAEGMIKTIDDEGLRSDCAIGVRSACDALKPR